MFDDAGQALKVAKKPAGVKQNQAEVELSGQSPVLNQVVDYDPEYNWVKQRMATPLDEAGLAKHTGLPVENQDSWLKDMAGGSIGPQSTPEAQEFYERLNQVMREVPKVDPRDLGKASQWGLDTSGKPVLIDYGFLKGMPLGLAGLGAAAASGKTEKR